MALEQEVEHNFELALELWATVNLASQGRDDQVAKAFVRIGQRVIERKQREENQRLEVERKRREENQRLEAECKEREDQFLMVHFLHPTDGRTLVLVQ